MMDAMLNGATLVGTSLINCKLQGSDLSGARFYQVKAP